MRTEVFPERKDLQNVCLATFGEKKGVMFPDIKSEYKDVGLYEEIKNKNQGKMNIVKKLQAPFTEKKFYFKNDLPGIPFDEKKEIKNIANWKRMTTKFFPEKGQEYLQDAYFATFKEKKGVMYPEIEGTLASEYAEAQEIQGKAYFKLKEMGVEHTDLLNNGSNFIILNGNHGKKQVSGFPIDFDSLDIVDKEKFKNAEKGPLIINLKNPLKAPETKINLENSLQSPLNN
jgi:hypothetical protein